MSGVLARVRAANADPTDPGVEVELPVAPGGWGIEHMERVANAVGVDTHSAGVNHLRLGVTVDLASPPPPDELATAVSLQMG